MIHERYEAKIGVGEDGLEAGRGFGVGEFAAEVKEVIGAEEAGGLGLVEGEDAIGHEIAWEAVEIGIDADADGVEDGGDAEGGDLGVVGD
jgi:hypothetical protein